MKSFPVVFVGFLFCFGAMACTEESEGLESRSEAVVQIESGKYETCQEFMEKYESCLKAKAPIYQHNQIEQGFIRLKALWGNNSETAAAASGFGRSCERAREVAKEVMKQQGCTF